MANKNNSDKVEYDTGAVRSADCEDFRYDLITPIGLRALAKTYAEGAEKFGVCNWENGMPAVDMLNHAIAHIYKFLGGDRGEDHLGHAAWNVLGAIHSIELWPEMNEKLLRKENCAAPEIAKCGASGAQMTSKKSESTDVRSSIDNLRTTIQNAKK